MNVKSFIKIAIMGHNPNVKNSVLKYIEKPVLKPMQILSRDKSGIQVLYVQSADLYELKFFVCFAKNRLEKTYYITEAKLKNLVENYPRLLQLYHFCSNADVKYFEDVLYEAVVK